MGTLFLFIILFAIFSISGVFTIIRKLLGGILGIFKEEPTQYGGQSSNSSQSHGSTSSDRKRNRQSQEGSERMRRFKSMAEDTDYEEAPDERVKMDEPIYEEMMNK